MEDQLYNDSFADGDLDISQGNMTDFHKDFSFRDGVNVTGYTIMSAGNHIGKLNSQLHYNNIVVNVPQTFFFCFVRTFFCLNHSTFVGKKHAILTLPKKFSMKYLSTKEHALRYF